MAMVARRVVTVNKMFAPMMENGKNKGQRMIVSPADVSEVSNLTEDQLAGLALSGSISIIGDAQVDDAAQPGEAQVFLPAATTTTSKRSATSGA